MAVTITASLGCALLSLSAWIIYLNSKSPRNLRLPPGPKGLPLVGNIFQIDPNQLWNALVKWEKEYGAIVHFRLFNQNIIVLSSGQVAGDILDRRAANYSQRPRMPAVEYLTGGLSIITMDHGDKWRLMRRAAHETLNARASTLYHPVQMRKGIQFAMDILNSPEKWHEHTYQFTSSQAASILYGEKSNSHAIIRDLSALVDDLSEAGSPGKYLANHISILEHVPDFLARWKQEMGAKHNMYTARLLRYFLTIKEAMLQRQDPGPSFCNMLVETHEDHGLDDLGSAWLAAMLYLAGYETAATALVWLIVAMIAFPEAQHKAQEELDTVVGRGRIPTLQDMENLPYMRAVVKEVLRWRPPGPMGVFHASLEDDIYEGYYIPKGSWVITNILSMNHDTAMYGPDPDIFRPERFMKEDGTHKASPPDTKDIGHYSFGFGRRICPGRYLALNTLLTFSIVLWATRLEPGTDANGKRVPPSTCDVGSGYLSRPPACKVLSRPRFPGAQDILKMAKEEWI
ncbi:cytochrome p450 [Moniliophthora roreri MCA 2997]|uniref:Cytochrome p450 n=1 Tax=Moniliophthora roreri (strain MCA 2997) TaxID=1381753 RepID=V2X011_MONRO|nr:cytochrome p450 [Moniliophthora roreri MCA 2997]